MDHGENDPLMLEWRAGSPAPASTPKHAGGRPKGGFQAGIDWELAERLYVEGKLDGDTRRWLTRKEIADAAGTTPGNIDQRSRRYGWPDKKLIYRVANGFEEVATVRESIAQVPASDIVQPPADKPRKPGGKAKHEPLAILDVYIAQFAAAIEKRRVRFDTIADFERAVRLRAFVMGQAESIKQTHTTVSLEIMQARHKQARAYVATTVDDAVAGVLGCHVPAAIDAEFVEVSPEHEGTPEPAPVSAVPVD